MASWLEFETAAPEFGAAGRRLLVGPDEVAIGFLASVSAHGAPHLAPVCPIFCDADLYISAGSHTPKANDLRTSGHWTLPGRERGRFGHRRDRDHVHRTLVRTDLAADALPDLDGVFHEPRDGGQALDAISLRAAHVESLDRTHVHADPAVDTAVPVDIDPIAHARPRSGTVGLRARWSTGRMALYLRAVLPFVVSMAGRIR